ncbi:MAG: hypothetical protein K6B54_04610 [Clostridia bacterium]|nr:hypothetical protein [Clostridia bacterium]
MTAKIRTKKRSVAETFGHLSVAVFRKKFRKKFREKFRFTRRRIRGTIHSNRAFAMGDSFDPRKAIGDFIQKGDKKHDKGKKTGNH